MLRLLGVAGSMIYFRIFLMEHPLEMGPGTYGSFFVFWGFLEQISDMGIENPLTMEVLIRKSTVVHFPASHT
jgi:hypothetical protein